MNEQNDTQQKLYDREAPITLSYLGEAGEELTVTVRPPTDELFIAREKKIKNITFADGRKKSFGSDEANIGLLEQILTEPGTATSDGAYYTIPELLRCEIQKSERAEDPTTVRIEMIVTAEIPVVHVLKIAKPAETEGFLQNYLKPTKPGKPGETVEPGFDYPVFKSLFRKLFVSVEGYKEPTVDGVPVWHVAQSVLIAAFYRMRESRELQSRNF